MCSARYLWIVKHVIQHSNTQCLPEAHARQAFTSAMLTEGQHDRTETLEHEIEDMHLGECMRIIWAVKLDSAEVYDMALVTCCCST